MEKLIRGIMEFRRNRRSSMKETFARLALGQKPEGFFIACCDSRVAADVFASAGAGDLFMVRNLGNIMPCSPDSGSTVAALGFALDGLKVRHIIVCGHSDCGAMKALAKSGGKLGKSPMESWLRHASKALPPGLSDADELSRRNVVLQLENLRTHERVKELERSGQLKLHGLWFHIQEAEVYYLKGPETGFILIDDQRGEEILRGVGS